MEYVTSFDYEKYSIDKRPIEEWLTRLYENSIAEFTRRDKKYLELVAKSDKKEIFDLVYAKRYDEVKEKDLKLFPFVVRELDNYLFFLLSSGYVDSNNFTNVFSLIENSVGRVVPATETDLLLLSFNDSIMGLYDNEGYFKNTMPFCIDEDKTFMIHQEHFGKNTIYDCIRYEFDALLAEKNLQESIDYYEQIKDRLSGYKIDPDKFDKTIHDAFDYIYYCISYELLKDNDKYRGNEWDNRDKYKSVLLDQGNVSKYSFQDETRELMAAFIKTDPDIKDNKTSTAINTFTKKCIEGDYFKKRCQNMSDEELDDLFMSLYYLGSLNFVRFPGGIKDNSELAVDNANNLVQAVEKVQKKEKQKNGKKST